ncbi:hypothetical protein [Mycolicibacterium thermoresistibile]
MRYTHAIAAATLVLTGCAGPAVVTTDDAAAPTSAAPPAPATTTARPSNALLVDASEYASPVDGRVAGYYFVSPSGRWSCAILPRRQAGCQATASSALPVTGAPARVPDEDGEPATPTAIVVGRSGAAHFAAPAEPIFRPDTGTAEELAFDRILAAAGFRCNVQEQSGISCLSEASGQGFTFAADGYTLSYTDVAPPA